MKIALSRDQDIGFRKEGGGRVKIIIVIKLYLNIIYTMCAKSFLSEGGLKCAARPKGPRLEGGGVKRAKARRAEAAGDWVHLTPYTHP